MRGKHKIERESAQITKNRRYVMENADKNEREKETGQERELD